MLPFDTLDMFPTSVLYIKNAVTLKTGPRSLKERI